MCQAVKYGGKEKKKKKKARERKCIQEEKKKRDSYNWVIHLTTRYHNPTNSN